MSRCAAICGWVLLIPLLLGTPIQAWGAPALELSEVLDSVRSTHPRLEQAGHVVDERDGEVLAARGGFDPTLSVSGKWAPVGYYPNLQVDAYVRQEIPVAGLSTYAGYRLGWGSYPIYKGNLETLSGGELRAGAELPLWRDRAIDKRRAAIQRATLELDQSELERTAQQVQVEREATKAYWTWVAAGKNLEVARQLLDFAEQREQGLRERIAAGSIPSIMLVDNQRLVLERKARVVDATLKLQEAALKLSLHLRDEQLNPIKPSADRLPQRFVRPTPPADFDRDALVADALQKRPDAQALATVQAARQVDERLAKNQRAPAIDVQAFVARDIGEGPAELTGLEFGVGVGVEIALPMRQARGKYQAARAKVSQVRAKRRALRDKVSTEVDGTLLSVQAAAQRFSLAEQQHDIALELAEAERESLRQGASDLLAVNLRELAAATAAMEENNALAGYHQACADFQAVLGQLQPGCSGTHNPR